MNLEVPSQKHLGLCQLSRLTLTLHGRNCNKYREESLLESVNTASDLI